MLGKQSEDSRPGFVLAEFGAVDGDPALQAFFKTKIFRFIEMKASRDHQIGQSDFLNITEPSKFTHFHHHEP